MNKYVILFSPFLVILIHKVLVFFKVKTICIWYLLTGHKCIGCGMTTAMVNLLQGKVKLAYQQNHLIIIVAPVLLYCWVSFIRKNFLKKI